MSPAHDVSRRKILRAAALGPLALAVGVDRLFGQTAARPPNIVFIMADDLGYADVSCYGRPDLSTPNIDRIAAKGVRFLQAYANSAVCSATRTALITGRYQYRLPVGLEEPLGRQARCRPAAGASDVAVVAEEGRLRHDAGRQVAPGGAARDSARCKSGYDHFYGFRGGAVDYYTHTGTDQKDDLWDDDVHGASDRAI